MTDRHERFTYLRELPRYLTELSVLLGRPVSASDLVPLHESEAIRAAHRAVSRMPLSRAEFSFGVLRSERFREFIARLRRTNPSDVYVWTPASDACGLFRAESLDTLNWSFPFEINREGILVFFPSDHADEMVLDFSRGDDGREVVEIDLLGPHWGAQAFELD